MPTDSKINLATILIGTYGVFVLVNALTYYFFLLPGETDIFRALVRVGSVGIVCYYLYQRNKMAYWVALVGSCLLGVLGILSIIFISISTGFDIEMMLNFAPIVVLLTVSFILLLPQGVRNKFES